jgi:murein DD-endopeptidase MepM/ murein hydrolase activator NlpD
MLWSRDGGHVRRIMSIDTGTLLGMSALLALAACGSATESGNLEREAAPDLGAVANALTGGAPHQGARQRGARPSLVTTLVAPPRPVRTTDGLRHLVYELIIENVGQAARQIEQIDVFEAGDRAPLVRYEGEALPQMLLMPETDETGRLPAGAVAFAFIDVTVGNDQRLPRELRHRIASRDDQRSEHDTGPSVNVVLEHPIRIGPPLQGGELVAVNGCCAGGHTRALLVVDDRLFLAQRFAIDFVRAEGSSSFEGDPSDNASYFLYGADALAVAPGRIIATSDGMAENVPTDPPPPEDVATATGNHVVQALDDGHFALYAHLQPGSLRVQPGDEVTRGQVLGLVGNSGNSTEPHLHFHVMDGPSPLGSNGLPYVFDHFLLQATIDVDPVAGPVIVPVTPPRSVSDRLPLDVDIIAFP